MLVEVQDHFDEAKVDKDYVELLARRTPGARNTTGN